MANSKENALSRATDDALDGLHALAAEAMGDELKRNIERSKLPKTITVEVDGKKETRPNPDYEPLDTKLLQVARQFLKDNGIDAPEAAPRFNDLTAQLRDLNVDDPSLPN